MARKPIDTIKAPIEQELIDFEERFRASMKSKVVLLDKIMNYIIKRKGKQLRPMLVFLCANSVGKSNDKTFVGASLIELLHTATLVHDDVVDDARFRRGFFSINALWQNKVAVLVGDFLLSRGLILAMDTDNVDLLRIVTNAVKEMSEGELLQMEKARKLDVSEELYLEVIRQKTASLIASCCAVGAKSGGADQRIVDDFYAIGQMIGMAFQIKDDIFDYGEPGIGKPVGIDLKEKKVTLPLILALKNASPSESKRILRLISKASGKDSTFKTVRSFVEENNGLRDAVQTMNMYAENAKAKLQEFEPSPYQESLIGLVDFTVQRTK